MSLEFMPDPIFERQLADFLDDGIGGRVKRLPGNEDFVPADSKHYRELDDEHKDELALEDEYFMEALEACVDGVMLRQLLEERAEQAEETYRAREFDSHLLDEFKEFLESRKYNYKEAVDLITSSAPSEEGAIELRKIFDLEIFRAVAYLIWDERTGNLQAYLNYFSNPAIATQVSEIYELDLGAEEQKTKKEALPKIDINEAVKEKEIHELTDEEFLFYLMKKEHQASAYFHNNYLDIVHGQPTTGEPSVFTRNADLIDKATAKLKVETVDRAEKLRKAGNILFRNAPVDDIPLLIIALDKDVYDQATFTLRPDDQRRSVKQRAAEAVAIIEEFASSEQAADLMREGLDDCIFSACQNEMKLKIETPEELEEAVRYASSTEIEEKMLSVLGLN